MAGYVPSEALLERACAGDVTAVARLISRAEAGTSEVRPALASAYRLAGRAHLIGITGVPGSGKSTLLARLVAVLRESGARVGVLAIDPSSHRSGGAILGDRHRMRDLVADPGVFIRSLATRGTTGGLAHGALEAVDLLDVAGYDTILIETVDAGQDDVDIARASHTTVVVSAPGLGDDIQAMQSGTLEIADIHVVSKCDRPDAQRTILDLEQMLPPGLRPDATDGWRIPVIGTSSMSGDGLADLASALARHRAHSQGPAGLARRRTMAEFRLSRTAEDVLLERFREQGIAAVTGFADRVANREIDPYTAAVDVLTVFMH
ncbi:MAG: methylmalonyl Co-A mutase-associated GTPase MeaB [Burkholderiales bacterium]